MITVLILVFAAQWKPMAINEYRRYVQEHPKPEAVLEWPEGVA